MHTRRVPRIVLAGVAAALAVAGLAGCRTSPNVAAYVGDDTITVQELQSAVDARLADDDIAAFAEQRGDAFTRQVLSLLVGEEVYEAAAEHWDVSVSDAQVRNRIDTLLGDQDPDAVYDQLAAQGISEEDVFENVRQQLVRQGIARAEGLDEALSPAALRQRYEQAQEQYRAYVFGYIAVPDEATADAVLAELTADPAGYAEVAARFDNGITLLQQQTRTAEELPGALEAGVVAAAPGTGFTVPLPDVPGFTTVVAFVSDVTVQPFEDVRADLEDAAESEVDDAVEQLVRKFRDGLDVTINPRYGVLQENAVVEGDGGPVDILDGGAGTAGG